MREWARKRLNLKPGITGLWQVLGANAIPFEEMVRLDYLYVMGWSLRNDLSLLARTVPLVLRGARNPHCSWRRPGQIDGSRRLCVGLEE